ncbi:hypothetical protein [Cryptosporangium sp. NPDC048952]|uniref:hypothetical protein n=1 Tax=Cryptosporangium sp. NPDC048952 TaxID=3363961 RepID=UPI0037130DD4
MPTIAAPAVYEAVTRVRAEPTDADAEHQLAEVLGTMDETLLPLEGLPPSREIVFTTVAAPIFDPLGRVPLTLSATGPGHPVPVERVLEGGRRLVQAAAIATRQARGRAPGGEASFGRIG